jgi:hypothetical protein
VVGVNLDTTTGTTPILDPALTTAALWVDRCILNNPTGGARQILYRNKMIHVTRCEITRLHEGLRPQSTTDSELAIVRGNNVLSLGSFTLAQTFIGNKYVSSLSTGGFTDFISGSSLPNSGQLKNNIVAYNIWCNAQNPILNYRTSPTAADLSGLAIVQNVFETRASSSSPLFQIHADGALTTPVNDVILFNNVIVGQRSNLGYNDHGSVLTELLNWYSVGNIFQDLNVKSDTFNGNSQTVGALTRSTTQANVSVSSAHGYSAGDFISITGASPSAYNGYFQILASPAPTATTFSYTMLSDPGGNNTGSWIIGPHPNRKGNWAYYFGCGCRADFNAKTVLSSFLKDYSGLRSYQPAANGTSLPASASAVNTPYNFPQFVDFKAYNGTTAGAGNGDYHLKPGSPAAKMQKPKDFVLKYDIEGKQRSAVDAAGAYSMQNQRILVGDKTSIVQGIINASANNKGK